MAKPINGIKEENAVGIEDNKIADSIQLVVDQDARKSARQSHAEGKHLDMLDMNNMGLLIEKHHSMLQEQIQLMFEEQHVKIVQAVEALAQKMPGPRPAVPPVIPLQKKSSQDGEGALSPPQSAFSAGLKRAQTTSMAKKPSAPAEGEEGKSGTKEGKQVAFAEEADDAKARSSATGVSSNAFEPAPSIQTPMDKENFSASERILNKRMSTASDDHMKQNMTRKVADVMKQLKGAADPMAWVKPPTQTQQLKTQQTKRQTEYDEEGEVVEAGEEQQNEFFIRRWAQMVIDWKRFDYFVAILIISNAVVIGVQTELTLKNIGMKPHPTFRILDLMYTTLFAGELLLRLCAEGAQFFSPYSRNIAWNLLDSFIVLSALGEEVFTLASGSTPNMSAIRLLRILRLVRVIRVIRVMRFFRDLRIMVHGIMSSGKSLFWCLLLLLLIMFIFSVCVMQVMAQELNDIHDNPEMDSSVDIPSLMDHFGSMMISVYTLHKAIFGGQDWGEVSGPLMTISPVMTMLFMVYISFAVLCVLNIVTGVFIENANKITMKDEEHVIMEDMSARQQWFEEVQLLFQRADVTGTGALDYPAFHGHVSDVRVQAFFRKLGLDVEASGSYGLFQLLDFNGDGQVDMDEFVLGCSQLHGNARSLDIARLRHDNKKLKEQLTELALAQTEQMSELGYYLYNFMEQQSLADTGGSTSKEVADQKDLSLSKANPDEKNDNGNEKLPPDIETYSPSKAGRKWDSL